MCSKHPGFTVNYNEWNEDLKIELKICVLSRDDKTRHFASLLGRKWPRNFKNEKKKKIKMLV